MQSIKINIPVGGSISVPCQGNGVWFESGTSTTSDLYIIVKPEVGTEFRLKPGQHVKEIGAMSGTWTMRAQDPTAAITGSVLIGAGEFADNNTLNKVTLDATFANSVTVMNDAANRVPVTLDPNQLLNVAGQSVTFTNSYASNSQGALTAVVVIAPGVNVNGMWIELASITGSISNGNLGVELVAKSGAAPATAQDGAVLLSLSMNAPTSTVVCYDTVFLPARVKLPAGMGLYLFQSNNGSGQNQKSVLYTVL